MSKPLLHDQYSFSDYMSAIVPTRTSPGISVGDPSTVRPACAASGPVIISPVSALRTWRRSWFGFQTDDCSVRRLVQPYGYGYCSNEISTPWRFRRVAISRTSFQPDRFSPGETERPLESEWQICTAAPATAALANISLSVITPRTRVSVF